jgi:thioredoxin-like negative regulator of GroEL
MKQILYFTSSWCQPCKMLSPTMESLRGQINYNKIDVDSGSDLIVKYKIRSIPTLVLVENGVEITRMSGNASPQSILEFYKSK